MKISKVPLHYLVLETRTYFTYILIIHQCMQPMHSPNHGYNYTYIMLTNLLN